MSKNVTIVVVPRERFSNAQESLESILANTDYPYELVYVDGGSPGYLNKYLKEKAKEHDFKIVRKDHFLSPNNSRNIGIKEVRTKYAVIIDNDVVVSKGWLKALVKGADETGAAIVTPLTCQGMPFLTEIHCAGGNSGIKIKDGERQIINVNYLTGKKIKDVQERLKREKTELAEFHCLLVDKAVVDKIGGFDEQMFNTMEHVDFCLSIKEAGGTIYFEPESRLTYLHQPKYVLSDISFYMLRWSNEWEKRSLDHIQEKWNLTHGKYFKSRYQNIGWRRKAYFIKPFCDKIIPIWRISQFFQNILTKLDHAYNRRITDRYFKLAK